MHANGCAPFIIGHFVYDINVKIETSRNFLSGHFVSVLKDISFFRIYNLKEQILNQTDKAFFVELLGALRLTLQLRNSRKSTGEDFLFSPVADENGCFFDSRKANDNEPKDADANGAYHIALKGLWALDTIRNTEEGKNPKLAITNKEWLSFAQAKTFTHE